MDGHSETHVRFVGAIFIHGIVPAHSRERVGNIHVQDILEQGTHHAFEHIQDIFLLDKAHLAVNLGELRLAVGPEVLVPEAADDLEIPVVAGDHQQLLEGLG